MKTYNIFTAQKVVTEIEPVTIILNRQLPEIEQLGESRRVFEREAITLATALCITLPGGTLDRLIIELLRRKASSLVVPLFDRKED